MKRSEAENDDPPASADEIAKRRDEILRRMLNTPPRPRKPKAEKKGGRNAADRPQLTKKPTSSDT
jgi:hypothetical protein